ncbi:hypothetical protein FF38_06097 [Lucilia cuprina]|uniref:Uncharacterized protein n=1 Tax=Lucilia cuprina TaxID=7375 RepID=A0A0L0CI09_LUCCU|nr:hypothetical protein FF38_06097 [Lucilia cuprina]
MDLMGDVLESEGDFGLSDLSTDCGISKSCGDIECFASIAFGFFDSNSSSESSLVVGLMGDVLKSRGDFGLTDLSIDSGKSKTCGDIKGFESIPAGFFNSNLSLESSLLVCLVGDALESNGDFGLSDLCRDSVKSITCEDIEGFESIAFGFFNSNSSSESSLVVGLMGDVLESRGDFGLSDLCRDSESSRLEVLTGDVFGKSKNCGGIEGFKSITFGFFNSNSSLESSLVVCLMTDVLESIGDFGLSDLSRDTVKSVTCGAIEGFESIPVGFFNSNSSSESSLVVGLMGDVLESRGDFENCEGIEVFESIAFGFFDSNSSLESSLVVGGVLESRGGLSNLCRDSESSPVVGLMGDVLESRGDFGLSNLSRDSESSTVMDLMGDVLESGGDFSLSDLSTDSCKSKSCGDIECFASKPVGFFNLNSSSGSSPVVGLMGDVLESRGDFGLSALSIDSGKLENCEGIEGFKSIAFGFFDSNSSSEYSLIVGLMRDILESRGDFGLSDLSRDSGKSENCEGIEGFESIAFGFFNSNSSLESSLVKGLMGDVLESRGDFGLSDLSRDSGKSKTCGDIAGFELVAVGFFNSNLSSESSLTVGLMEDVLESRKDFGLSNLSRDSGKFIICENIEGFKSIFVGFFNSNSSPESSTVVNLMGDVLESRGDFGLSDLSRDSESSPVVGFESIAFGFINSNSSSESSLFAGLIRDVLKSRRDFGLSDLSRDSGKSKSSPVVGFESIAFGFLNSNSSS